MIGLKEVCALIVAGGLGAGGAVAVQKVKPKPRVERKAPAVRKAASAPAPRPKLEDCPLPGIAPGGALLPEFASALPASPQQLGLLPPAGPGAIAAGDNGWRGWGGNGGSGGAGGGGGPGPTPPAVPEPAAWAMMISGFGLVGVAMRLRPQSQAGKGDSQAA